MSRHGYMEDDGDDPLQAGRWRGRVASAIRGKRGQKFLRDLLAAMDEMQEKRLVANAFEANGEVCALGSVARVRGIEMPKYADEQDGDYDYDGIDVGGVFGIASVMAKEIMYWNDEGGGDENPEQRFARMRRWVVEQIKAEPAA